MNPPIGSVGSLTSGSFNVVQPGWAGPSPGQYDPVTGLLVTAPANTNPSQSVPVQSPLAPSVTTIEP